MQKIIQFVRKYPFSLLCILVIWFLSFFNPPETELEEVPFIDKWVHIAMYGGTCSVLWIEYLRSHSTLHRGKLFLWAWLALIIMSGIIELLQEYCTEHRSGDWLDLAANSVGITLAVGFGLLLYFLKVFRHDKPTM